MFSHHIRRNGEIQGHFFFPSARYLLANNGCPHKTVKPISTNNDIRRYSFSILKGYNEGIRIYFDRL